MIRRALNAAVLVAACATGRPPVNEKVNDFAHFCEADEAESVAPEVRTSTCYELGRHLSAPGEGRDVDRAIKAFGRACAGEGAGARLGCRELAMLFLEGEGRTPNVVASAEFSARACELGDPDACLAAGALFDGGRGHLPQPDRAVALWRRACDLGSGEGCALFGLALLKGNGVDRDRQAGEDALGKACRLGVAAACPPK